MNAIALAKKYEPLLDEVYQNAAKTAALESPAHLVKAGANANEIIIPKLTMSGMANYSRNDGYVKGDVNLTWETVRFNYERGRMFSVDAMDNEESQDIAFGSLAGEFMRTKVIPEIDAFRFASIAGTEGMQSLQTKPLITTMIVLTQISRFLDKILHTPLPSNNSDNHI